MAATQSKRSTPPAEPGIVATPDKPVRPKAAPRPRAAAKPKPAAPRKRSAVAKPAPPPAPDPPVKLDSAPELVESTPAPLAVAASPHVSRKRRVLPVLGSLILACVSLAAAAAMLFVVQWNRSPEQPPAALEAFVNQQDGPVYWAGSIPFRRLELTRTADGTFVRYLPAGIASGDAGRALTVATYPLENAYATATERAKSRATTSRAIAGGGIAVWTRAEPTSVYVAFPRVPHLVEVYAPNAAEARRLALSGRIALAP